jgi:hypothetical protein
LVAAIVRAVRSIPATIDVAERLDLATGDHNRIATGLCLLGRGDRSAFAQAAIQDGINHLRRLKGEEPHRELARFAWRRNIGLIVLFVAATLLAPAGDRGPVDRLGEPARMVAAARVPAERAFGTATEDEGRTTDRLTSAPSSHLTTARAESGHGLEVDGGSPPRSPGQPMGGRAGEGSAAKVNPFPRSASAHGESTRAPSLSESRAAPRKTASTPRQTRSSRIRETGKADQQQSASIGQGVSGGGAMAAVQNQWAQRAATHDSEHEEEDSDEAVEDESETSQQRGGVQPSLKDRNEAPSRELGISGEEGPPGAGRGGPTPPKKSRGTASLVLGVPIPDFVKGRLGPGTTKVTNERIEPLPTPGDPSVAAEAARRSLPESPSRRFDAPAAFAYVVREYLVSLHSADGRPQLGPPPAAPEPAPGADSDNVRSDPLP